MTALTAAEAEALLRTQPLPAPRPVLRLERVVPHRRGGALPTFGALTDATPARPSPAPPPHAWVEALGEPAWVVDASRLTVVACNAAALGWLGRPRAALLGAAAATLLASPEDAAFWSDVAAGHHGVLDSDTVCAAAVPQGAPRHVHRTVKPLADEGGLVAAYLVRLTDRSDARRRDDEREELVAQLQATLESTADGLLVTDVDGRVRAFNRRFAQLWDLPAALARTRDDAALRGWMVQAQDDGAAFDARLRALQAAQLAEDTFRVTLRSGRVLDCVTRPRFSRGQPCGRVWSFRDQTELISASHRIATLATTDALTGVLNRREFAKAVGVALCERSAPAAARAPHDVLGLMVLDLDHFRQVNDTLGERHGDRVLRDVTARLRASLREDDCVARLAGDQFALLVRAPDARGVEAAAQRLIDEVAQPMDVDGVAFTLTASIGVAFVPGDGDDVETLMNRAEGAMRSAKQSGRGCVRLVRAQPEADARGRMQLDHAMRQALATQAFRLVYQPQVDIASGDVVGVEALLRWTDPVLGELPPCRFIPVAEDSGFIVALGQWVLKQAVAQAARWHDEGLAVRVAVNVSALQFQQAGFVERVHALLVEHALPGELLELELTESLLLRDADDAVSRLHQLATMGVQLSIDDFGTGFSSLTYLRRFHVDRLKIDRGFMQGIPGDRSNENLVRAIVQMGKALGLRLIAEGVETEAQRRFLAGVGCDEYQGWLCVPALPPDVLAERVLLPRRVPATRAPR